MSVEYGADVWWEKQELETYFVELYGQERGRELHEELMARLADGERELDEALYATVWGDEDEIVLGQPEMQNHVIYSVDDHERLMEDVYDGGVEALREESGYED